MLLMKLVILRRKDSKSAKYINCGFLMPTSNIMARFFSDAGYADDDLRQRLLPMRLEQQLFLKFNKKYWNAKLVNEIVNEKTHKR